MKSINIFFDNTSHQAIASIDGYEAYRVSTSSKATQGFTGTYIVMRKCDVNNEWVEMEEGPEDLIHEFEDFKDACDVLMKYLENHISMADFELQPL